MKRFSLIVSLACMLVFAMAIVSTAAEDQTNWNQGYVLTVKTNVAALSSAPPTISGEIWQAKSNSHEGSKVYLATRPWLESEVGGNRIPVYGVHWRSESSECEAQNEFVEAGAALVPNSGMQMQIVRTEVKTGAGEVVQMAANGTIYNAAGSNVESTIVAPSKFADAVNEARMKNSAADVSPGMTYGWTTGRLHDYESVAFTG